MTTGLITSNSTLPLLSFTIVNLNNRPRTIRFLNNPVHLDSYYGTEGLRRPNFYHTFHLHDVEPSCLPTLEATLKRLAGQGLWIMASSDLMS